MTLTQSMLDAAKTASAAELQKALLSSKKSFLDTFRDFISLEDLKDLDTAFEEGFRAKIRTFTSSSSFEVQESEDEYEASMNTIAAIGDRYEIVGKAKAGVFVRSVAHTIITGAVAVAGAVLQAGLGIVLPGLGSLIGAGANAGLQWVTQKLLGD